MPKVGLDSPRVIITKGFVGICHMQVCAVAVVADNEILEVANKENPSGTSLGWCEVIRSNNKHGQGPVRCNDDPERLHLLLVC